MKTKVRIVFAAQDAGGANALAPVIESAIKKCSVLVLATKYAVSIFKKRGIAAIDCSAMDSSSIEGFFLDFAPNILIAGTSVGMSIEKILTERARQSRIPSLAVVEWWGNYALRFSGERVGDWRYLPDVICVTDQRMKRECIDAGITADKIVVTGNPHLGEAARGIKRANRLKWDVVVISQSFLSAPQEHLLPFDEFSVLRDLFAYPGIDKIRNILVRLHPKDDLGVFRRFLDAEQPKGLKISLDKDGDLYSILGQARLVVGMSSIVLLEAAMAGVPVLRYQPGLPVERDIFPRGILEKWAESYDGQKFYQALERVLLGKSRGGVAQLIVFKKLCQPKKATQKILKTAFAMVGGIKEGWIL